jgi:PAS domain S-box-containing protein
VTSYRGIIRDITEARKAEQALRKSEAKYRRIVDTATEGIWVLGPDTMTTFVNARMAEMLGYSSQEMIGRPGADFMFEEDVPDHLQKMQNRRQGISENYERQFRRKDGQTVWTLASATPVFDDKHCFQGSFGMFTDITGRKEAETELRKTHEYLEQLISSANVMIAGLDALGHVRLLNEAAERITGYTVEELQGVDWFERIVPKDRYAYVWKVFQDYQQKTGSMPGFFENPILTKTGEERFISWQNSTILSPDRVISTISFGVDITERKRAESIMNARLRLLQFAAVHTLDELLQATLDELETLTGSQVGFYHFLEPDQQTLSLQTWSTRTLREMCRAEAKGRHYSIAQAGVWVDCVRERRPVIHNDYASLPHRRGMPPGHAPVIRELVVPVFRGDRITAILGVGNKPRDYTEGDVEIVSSLADLTWDIAERKRAEKQAEERQAELLYVSRLNTLGEMASGLAHELSQPLSAILSHANACARRIASSQLDIGAIERSLEKVVGQAERAGNILGRVRALAQRRPRRFSSVDMNETVRSVVDLTASEARHAGIEVRLELNEELPLICADMVQIEQVLLNLVRNAIEAMHLPGQTRHLLTIRSGARGSETVQIEVCDTGVGLPEADANRVFEPFFTTKANGLGVGLSISRTIVEMHDGALEARRNADCGSTLVLALPVVQPQERKAANDNVS